MRREVLEEIKKLLSEVDTFEDVELKMEIHKKGSMISTSVNNVNGKGRPFDIIQTLVYVLCSVIENEVEDEEDIERAIDVVTDILRETLL